MSRFDGARQGIGVWVFGLADDARARRAGRRRRPEYNVLEPRPAAHPVGEGTLTTGGMIALLAILLGTLLFAALRRQGRRALPPQGGPGGIPPSEPVSGY